MEQHNVILLTISPSSLLLHCYNLISVYMPTSLFLYSVYAQYDQSE